MKKVVVFIFMFCSAFFLNAFTAENDPAPKVQPVYRAMTIGGDLNATVSVSVNPIVADISAAEGTPFNMLGDDVLQSSGYVGRKIADWMLFSNTNRCGGIILQIIILSGCRFRRPPNTVKSL